MLRRESEYWRLYFLFFLTFAGSNVFGGGATVLNEILHLPLELINWIGSWFSL